MVGAPCIQSLSPLQCLTSRIRGVGYADLKPNPTICRSYVSALKAMGHHAVLDGSNIEGVLNGGSTDMGMSASLHVMLSSFPY